MKTYGRSILTGVLTAACILAFSIGVLTPLLPPFVGAPDIEKHERLVWPRKPTFRLKNNQGTVLVRSDTGNHILADVRIRGYERTHTSSRQIQQYLANMMKVEETDDALRLVSEPEDQPDRVEFVVDVNLYVPRGTNVEVDSANGNVRVMPGCGNVIVRGRNTDIEIQRPQGSVTATSTNGQISAIDLGNDTRLQTVNGNVNVYMVGGTLRASTINGAIVAHALRPELRYCELTAQNGGITLVLSAACAAFVEARTERGAVRCDLPIDTSHGVRRLKHIEGNIGGSRMYVSMETLNGNVWITRSKP